MDADDSSDLVITEVSWEEKPGNGWLLREVFDLLLFPYVAVTVAHGGDGKVDCGSLRLKHLF